MPCLLLPKPDILYYFVTQVQSDWIQRDSAQISFIQGKPTLAAVALSGNYNDLTNRPTTSSGLTQADWTQQDSTQGSFINNKPFLKTVATTGRFSDLVANSGQPQSVTAADWNATTVSGSIIPLVNKPSIPAAQVSADWNSTSGLSQILNQPTLAPVALSNKYTDLSNRPAFGPVATSNQYSDLTDAPQQADYALLGSNATSLAVINKPTSLSAFANDTGFYKANDNPTFGSVTTIGGVSSGGSLSAIGAVSFQSGQSVALASNLAGTIDSLAGTLTYNPPGGASTPAGAVTGSVDIFGAGSAPGSRLLNLWDNVTVQGLLGVAGALTAPSATVSGSVSTGPLVASSVSTGGNITVTGTMAVAGSASTGNLTATSLKSNGTLIATGLSTLSGGATVSGSNFIVNTAIGIGTTGPSASLHIVGGGAIISGTVTAGALSTTGTLNVGGTSTLSNNLTVAGSATISGTLTTNGSTVNPPGTILMFVTATIPAGYLLCDGSAVSRTVYSMLFAVVGITYGSGNGSTTFALPDFRSRTPIGSGTGTGLTPRTVGVVGGTETTTLTIAQMPVHSHSGYTGFMDRNASHLHYTYTGNVDDGNWGGGPAGSQYPPSDGDARYPSNNVTQSTNTDHAHALSIDNAGGGAAHNIMQPFIGVAFIVKT